MYDTFRSWPDNSTKPYLSDPLALAKSSLQVSDLRCPGRKPTIKKSQLLDPGAPKLKLGELMQLFWKRGALKILIPWHLAYDTAI